MKGRVLIVAGSDSGGGAGIQADLKAVTCLGGFAMTAITALTAQNTLGVHAIHAVPIDFVRSQIRVVIDDLGADAVKTGMLATSAIIDAVADELAAVAPRTPRIVDPVMVAKGGDRLLAEDAIGALTRRLVAGAALVTPNLPEAAVLAGRPVRTVDEMRSAAHAIRAAGAGAVLLKGGHLDGAIVTDLLLSETGEEMFVDDRIDSRHTHGTGCTLASAIAAGIAQGLSLRDAVARGRAYVRAAIASAPGYGHGHGPLDHAHTVGAFPVP
jgi:hydroxymethylpyrimidine/phosphomethylpyrimidine kinase